MIRAALTKSRDDERELDGSGLQPLPPWDTWATTFPLNGSYFHVYRPVPTTPSASPATRPPGESLYEIRSPALISAPLLAVED